MEESLNARLARREREIRQSMDRQTDDRTKQGRALVEILRRPHPARVGPYSCVCATCETRAEAADTLSWALDRIAALEGALREVEWTDAGRLNPPGLNTEVARLTAQVTAWQDRFKAIVGESSPDSAGNAVITLQRQVAALQGELAEAQQKAADTGAELRRVNREITEAEARIAALQASRVLEARSRYQHAQHAADELRHDFKRIERDVAALGQPTEKED